MLCATDLISRSDCSICRKVTHTLPLAKPCFVSRKHLFAPISITNHLAFTDQRHHFAQPFKTKSRSEKSPRISCSTKMELMAIYFPPSYLLCPIQNQMARMSHVEKRYYVHEVLVMCFTSCFVPVKTFFLAWGFLMADS